MSESIRITSDDRLAEFHRELELIARDYKKINQVPSEVNPNSFAFEFLKLSREMEFELLDNIVSHIKSKNSIDKVAQKFVLKLLRGDLNVAEDRYENLVHLAKIYIK
ncbi:MAG: hypothetical protein K940chlam3_00534 [Chlamydiae bacterium]|nr:hypothetical protein [Chlamydiota bacterium]